jgi:hypothetical protein
MKKIFLSVLITSAASFLLVACLKEVNGINHDFLKATDFWKDVGPNHQVFSVNTASGGTITGAKGTKITIPGGAFMDANGNILTEIVSLDLVEITAKKDILFSGIFTEANGQTLVSGGEFLVEARKKNGEALQLNPQFAAGPQGVRVEIPAANGADREMNLFVRRERQPGGNSNDNSQTWVPASYAPFGGGANSYTFNLPEFSWVNIDKFYSDPRPKTTITALPAFKDNKNVNNVEVMLIFTDVNTVCPIPYNSMLQKFESYHDAVPIGAEVIVVIIGEDAEGNIQFGSKKIIVVPDMHVEVEVGKTTKAMMDMFISELE